MNIASGIQYIQKLHEHPELVDSLRRARTMLPRFQNIYREDVLRTHLILTSELSTNEVSTVSPVYFQYFGHDERV